MVVACPLVVVAGAAVDVPGTFPGVVVPGDAVVGAPDVVVTAEKALITDRYKYLQRVLGFHSESHLRHTPPF